MVGNRFKSISEPFQQIWLWNKDILSGLFIQDVDKYLPSHLSCMQNNTPHLGLDMRVYVMENLRGALDYDT